MEKNNFWTIVWFCKDPIQGIIFHFMGIFMFFADLAGSHMIMTQDWFWGWRCKPKAEYLLPCERAVHSPSHWKNKVGTGFLGSPEQTWRQMCYGDFISPNVTVYLIITRATDIYTYNTNVLIHLFSSGDACWVEIFHLKAAQTCPLTERGLGPPQRPRTRLLLIRMHPEG